MYRRVLITVMAGATLVSLCSLAQDTKSNQTPATGDSQPAATANSQTPATGDSQPAATTNSKTPAASKTPKEKQSRSKLTPWKKNKKSQNPIANVDSKQPDKVLFDRAADAMQHHKFDVARLSLQTLINTYPDSEYVARAKLAIADSWYEEGGSAAMAQAESEYKDFITFFPQMTEASEAQMKIANIHYKEMEKADRDPTHARRAEDEYRQLILQFPDSPLVPQAKQRLIEVQEVLAQREFMIGHFYFLREAYPAAIARLQSVVDTYPLYSGADQALFELGSSYEREVEIIRRAKLPETAKGALIKRYNDGAAGAYDKILTRYPLEERAGDARKRLEAMKQPVPKATPQAIAQNKAEISSRGSLGTVAKLKENFHRGPDVREATKSGEPTLLNPKQASAPEIVRAANMSVVSSLGSGNNTVTVEHLNDGAAPAANAPIPRSDAAPATGDSSASPTPPPPGDANNSTAIPPANGTASAPLPPTQVNDAAPSGGSTGAASNDSAQQASPSVNNKTESTSKKKKKKVLGIF